MSRLRDKRRETEVFSLSFLDCICCGFGAVLLVFLLTISTKSMVDKGTVDEVRERVKKAESEMDLTKAELDRIAELLAAAQLELRNLESQKISDQLKLSERKRELLLMLQQTGAMKDALERAGNAPEWMAVPKEGHGFYKEENNIAFYQRLEAFLSRNIGPGKQ
jgi:hypothetical protein